MSQNFCFGLITSEAIGVVAEARVKEIITITGAISTNPVAEMVIVIASNAFFILELVISTI